MAVEVEVTETETPEATVVPVVIPASDPAVLAFAEEVGRLRAKVEELEARTYNAQVTAEVAESDASAAVEIAVAASETAEVAVIAAVESMETEEVEETPAPEPEPDQKPHKEHPWFRSREEWRS